MAQSLAIINQDASISIDLIGGTMELRSGGWSTHTALDGDGIWEVIEVVSRDTDANLRTAKRKFDAIIDQARLWAAKPYEDTAVYFTWKSEGENLKKAIIFDGESEINSDGPYSPLLGETIPGAFLRLSVLRHPAYEVANDTDSDTGLSTLGGTFVPSISPAGSSPGRIASMVISDAGVPIHSKIWCGIRPTRLGTAGFISVWEAEDGTNFTDAADAADAGASGGNRVTISFATDTTLAKRFTLRWGQVAGGNYDDIIGRYLVLGRVKLSSAATEVAVQLRHGWAGSTSTETIVGTTYLSAVDNSNLTDWNLVELGFVDIPPTGNRGGIFSSTMDDYFLLLYAEQLAGASLYFDCFVLIPAEHLVTADGGLVTSGGGTLTFYTGADDSQTAVGVTAAGLNYNADFSFTNWEWPVEGGIMVIAAQPSTAHTIASTAAIALTIWPRFKSYDDS